MNFNLEPNLCGTLLALRPLQESDFPSLFSVASDPLIWEQHPNSDRYQETVFRAFFDDAMASQGAFLIYDISTNEIIGSSRYAGLDLQNSEVEIGWTFLSRAYWGGSYNTELKFLMLKHAFQYVDSVVFKVGASNIRSQKAVLKLGAQREEALTNAMGIPVICFRLRRSDFHGFG